MTHIGQRPAQGLPRGPVVADRLMGTGDQRADADGVAGVDEQPGEHGPDPGPADRYRFPGDDRGIGRP